MLVIKKAARFECLRTFKRKIRRFRKRAIFLPFDHKCGNNWGRSTLKILDLLECLESEIPLSYFQEGMKNVSSILEFLNYYKQILF